MTSLTKATFYGFLVWLIAFLAAIIIFPIHETHRPLFESIMPVVISAGVSIFAYKYLMSCSSNFKSEGLKLGLVFLTVNLLIDLPLMLLPSPMQMTVSHYFQDIGITYLMIPPITWAMGALVSSKVKN